MTFLALLVLFYMALFVVYALCGPRMRTASHYHAAYAAEVRRLFEEE